MAPHSSILAWKIPWTEEPGGLQSMGSLSDTTERLHFHFSLSWIGGGNGNPLQCSSLENPRGGRAWWADIYGVTQSRTRLKLLSSSGSSSMYFKMTTVISVDITFNQLLVSVHFSSVHFSGSVVSDTLRPHGLQPTRLLHPCDSPGKSTGVGCHCLPRFTIHRNISNHNIV